MRNILTTDIPQANTLHLIGELLALLDVGIKDNRDLSKLIGIVPREVDYYKHAARILGFIEPINRPIFITKRGQEYLKAKKPQEKHDLIINAIKNAVIFKELLSNNTISELNKLSIIEFLKKNTRLSGSTLGRRANSIMAWLKIVSDFDPEDFISLAKRTSMNGPNEYNHYKLQEEGSLHKELKLKLAAKPELLGEQLNLVQIEYSFPTNDRADLLFIDKKTRFVAVEVEVDVGAHDLAGLLQAAKYRTMLAIQYGLHIEQVRAMIAAHNIHPVMKERALRYNIVPKEISR